MTDMLLETAVERWLRQFDNVYTHRSYQRSLLTFVTSCGTGCLLRDVTPEMVDDWYFNLRDRTTVYQDHPYRPSVERKLSPYSIANYVRCVRSFFNWCVMRGYLQQSPIRFLKLKKPQTSYRSKAISDVVLETMFRNVVQKGEFHRLRDGALLTLLATYGFRCGSITSLKLSSFDFEGGWIHIHAKGDRELDLPLEPIVTETLKNWLEHRAQLEIDPPHDFVFVTNRTSPGNARQPLTELGLQQIIYRMSERASQDGRRFGPHSIRHWRGQSLADARISPKLIQQLLGHSNIQTTLEFYCNQDSSRLRSLVKEFSVTAK